MPTSSSAANTGPVTRSDRPIGDETSKPTDRRPWAFLCSRTEEALEMPKIAFSTLACPTWDWEQVVTGGIRHGYDGVEIRQIGGETDLLKVPAFEPSQRGASRDFLHRCPGPTRTGSFVVCGLASSVRFDYPQKEQRDEQLRIGRAYVELAAELEAGFVRVFGDVLPLASQAAETDAALAQIAEGLRPGPADCCFGALLRAPWVRLP